jgi:hypothetical protein
VCEPSFPLQSTYVLIDWIVPGPLAPLNHYRVLSPMRLQVCAARVNHLVIVAQVSPELLGLALRHPPAADVRVHSS